MLSWCDFCLSIGGRTLSYADATSRKSPTKYSPLEYARQMSIVTRLRLSVVLNPFCKIDRMLRYFYATTGLSFMKTVIDGSKQRINNSI